MQRLDLCLLPAAVVPEDAPAGPVGQYEALVLVGRAFLRAGSDALELEPGQTSQACGEARLFERLERHIEARIKQDIGVEQLAHFAGLSQGSLCQVFKGHARTSPRSHIRRKKLEHVQAALMDPAVRVASATAVALD